MLIDHGDNSNPQIALHINACPVTQQRGAVMGAIHTESASTERATGSVSVDLIGLDLTAGYPSKTTVRIDWTKCSDLAKKTSHVTY